MSRLRRWLYLLAVLVAVAGLVALALDIRQDGPTPVLEAFAGQAASSATVWLAAAGWLVFALLGRWLSELEPRERGLSRPEPGEKPAASRDDSSPGLSIRRGAAERLRLEALMRGQEPETAAFVDRAAAMAVEVGASDLHFQPAGDHASVTLRVRGELREVARYPLERHSTVVRRLKVMADMPPYVTAEPQDGRIAVTTPHGAIEMRLSTVPAGGGERVALRLAGEAETRPLEQLGLRPRDRQRFETLLAEPQGLIVLTGPTGCGKTTTLYSALHHIHKKRGASTSIASIEDPVEVELPFVHQVPVDRARGMSFANALRSVLRQDPNVLMVGEIRDAETAQTAVQAGLSGHLILTTLHADSTLGVFPRVIDLGTEPFLAASATLACVSQRLVPRLCADCRHPRSISAAERRQLGGHTGEFFTAEGCATCERRGAVGRIAVFELLMLDAELRRRIAAKASPGELREAALAAGSVFFADSALELATNGEISLDEARRFMREPLS